MANFDKAIAVILANEGGYCCVPGDAGGETNFGICKRDNPDIDIKNLTRDQATQYYLDNWWNKYHFSQVADDDLATYWVDHAVNCGMQPVTLAVQKTLQDALQQAGNFAQGITVDGLIGPATISLANQFWNPSLMLKLQEKMWGHYLKVLDAHPEDSKFTEGWRNRCYRL